MTNAIARPARPTLSLLAALLATSCTSFVEVPVETPLQSKIDVSSFRRVLVAGFVTDLGEQDVELGSETTRLLQNQLRSNSKLQVLEPDHPPLHDALERVLESMGEGGKYSKEERDQYRLESDKVLQDAEFWRKVGEEFQQPLIVTGRLGFEAQNRSGFQAEERVIRDPTSGRQRLVRGNRYLERKGFALSAEFQFVDGRSGQTLHKEKFTEEVLYGEDQKISPLSSYFELMDRLLPNFLGVISPQKIRGTRILLP
ncbi:MAG TPA: hypothetical protein VFO85_15260 [Vicinamibacteria bacterium]|nr:hypothetical protein [Vicinamibacteria bacterium]